MKEDFGKLTNQIRNDPSKKCSIKAPPTNKEIESITTLWRSSIKDIND